MDNIVHQVHSVSWFLYTNSVLNHGYKFTRSENWSTEIDHEKIKIPEQYKTVLWQQEKYETQVVFEGESSTGLLTIDGSTVSVHVSATSPDNLAQEIQLFRDILIPVVEDEAGVIHVKFWYLTNSGPQSLLRSIAAPSWEEINNNYVGKTHDLLNGLMKGFKPSQGGQLLLWQGDPGAGKTYALRALCSAWRKWCSIDYIIDPEAFFGGSPAYLMQILSSDVDDFVDWTNDDDDDLPVAIPHDHQFPLGNSEKKWKLLILEDAGEFLAMDAKERVGHALSRLLNVTDGFIGQGLNILILITTNEELGQLHPAVSRPGRSASIVPFQNFSAAQANEWLAPHNLSLPKGKGNYSLADLYSLVNDYESNRAVPERKGLGFAV